MFINRELNKLNILIYGFIFIIAPLGMFEKVKEIMMMILIMIYYSSYAFIKIRLYGVKRH